MNNKDRNRLGEEKILKLLISFSIPAVIGMVVNALYNVVDRMFIGNIVGVDGLAGIVAVFPIMLVSMAFTMLIGFGSSSLLSLKLGQQKHDEAEIIVGNGLVLLIIVSVTLSVISLIFIKPILIFIGAEQEILPFALDYGRIILFGNVFMAIGFGMNNYIRAQGKPITAALTMVIGALTNIVLDWIFISIFKMGMQGAALATIISQAVSAIWVLLFFLSGKSSLKIHSKNLLLKSAFVFKIMALGIAPFLLQLAASLMQVILNKSLITYGDMSYIGGKNAIAAIGITSSVSTLLLMPLFGINQGVQPIIGYNYGAKKFNRVKEALKLGFIAATSIVTFGYLITRLFPKQLVIAFIAKDKLTPEMLMFGQRSINIVFLVLPIIGLQVLGSSYYQATGRPLYATILSLSRQVLFLIPSILILPLKWGLEGVLYSIPVADVLATSLTVSFIFFEFKKLHLKEKEIHLDQV